MRTTRPHESGQVLPLFVLFLVVLLSMAALAIDVSSKYSTLRAYRSIADAASLAGAQDLQLATGRGINASIQQTARRHALDSLKSQLNASGDPVGCPVSSDIADCILPGTGGLKISIRTPALACVLCAAGHSVQVSVRNPAFQLSFARVLGQNSWNVGLTSVAGLTFKSKYALETLRPPDVQPNGSDQNRDDININGSNSLLTIVRGDVGTNTSVQTNSSDMITLATDYFIDHIDTIVPDPWNKDILGNPQGRLITTLLPDPNYMYPDWGTGSNAAPHFAQQTDGAYSSCPTLSPDWPTSPAYTSVLSTAICYKPGIYDSSFDVQSGDVAYLMPGAYRFDGGIKVRQHSSFLGGLVPGRNGVVVVVPEGSGTLTANAADRFWLNLGDGTTRSLAALGWGATPALVQTPPPGAFVISLEVLRDNTCFSGTTPRLCSDNGNRSINLPGNGQLEIAGVIYAPSDRVQIQGDNTVQQGLVGQIIAWTVTYGGGAHLTQDYPGGEDVGILRLDAACTLPNPPPSCNP